MTRKPPSPHKQTLRLIAITCGVCLVSALIAAGPSMGVQTLWNGALGAVQKVLTGVAAGLLEPPRGDEGSRNGTQPLTNGKGPGEGTDPKSASNGGTSRGPKGLGSLGTGESNHPGSLSKSTLTATPSRMETPTPTWQEGETATEAPVTSTPTHPATATPTTRTSETPTPTVAGRRLALGAVEVRKGEEFQVALSCSDLMGVAGCDFGVGFDPERIDLSSVQRTALTDSFLVISKKQEGCYLISMAAVAGLPPGPGVLVLFEGRASSSQGQGAVAPLRFLEAKMYDEMSRAIPVATQDGIVTILADGETAAEESPDTTELSQDPVATDPTHVSVAANPTPIGGDLTIGETPLAPLPIWPVVIGIAPSNSPTPSPSTTPASQSPSQEVIQALLQTDLTKDGVVDSRDLFEFLRYWRQSAGEE